MLRLSSSEVSIGQGKPCPYDDDTPCTCFGTGAHASKRTDAAKRFKRVENATAVIWKMLLVAQGRFRRLNGPELITEVHHGAQYVNGVRVQERALEVAA